MTAIEQIRAELDAATPGPWTVERFGNVGEYEIGHGVPDKWDYRPRVVCCGEPAEATGIDLANATLIAHAPTYLAALLDVAIAAEAIVARHPDSLPGEHPAVDMLRPVLNRLAALYDH